VLKQQYSASSVT